jgi:hypothetical protein
MKTFTLATIAVLGLAAAGAAAADKKPPATAPWPPKNTVVVTPAPEPTTTMAIRGRPPTGRLQTIGTRANQLQQQTQTLRTSIVQLGWNAVLRTDGVEPINDAVGALAREVKGLQTISGASNYSTGNRLASDLQRELTQITAAEQALSAARDTPGASAALTQMSVSLDKMIKTIDTLPPCCTEGICCHVALQ